MIHALKWLRDVIVPTIGPRPKKLEDSKEIYRDAVNRFKEVTIAVARDELAEESTSPDLTEITNRIDDADQLMRDALTQGKR